MTRPSRDPENFEAHFWAQVDRTDTCWLWTGYTSPKGYGSVWVPGLGDMRVHRYVYESLVGPIPDGLVIDHLCRVRNCVNPAHLEPVTNRENVLRGVGFAAQEARQTHCKRGHEFTPENTRRAKGKRHCRACHRLRRASWRKTRAA